MAAKRQYVWAIYFVGFDTEEGEEAFEIEPFVGKERIETSSKQQEVMTDAKWAALLRGGELLAVVEDDEKHAEAIRAETEAQLLRKR